MEPIDDADLELVMGGAYHGLGIHFRPGATPPAPFARVAVWGRRNYVAELKGGIHGSPTSLPGRG